MNPCRGCSIQVIRERTQQPSRIFSDEEATRKKMKLQWPVCLSFCFSLSLSLSPSLSLSIYLSLYLSLSPAHLPSPHGRIISIIKVTHEGPSPSQNRQHRRADLIRTVKTASHGTRMCHRTTGSHSISSVSSRPRHRCTGQAVSTIGPSRSRLIAFS